MLWSFNYKNRINWNYFCQLKGLTAEAVNYLFEKATLRSSTCFKYGSDSCNKRDTIDSDISENIFYLILLLFESL